MIGNRAGRRLRRSVRVVAAVCVLIALAAMTGEADIICEIGDPDHLSTGFLSDFSPTGSVQLRCNDFVLGEPAKLTDVHWWGVYAYGGAPTDDFTLRVYPMASGLPATTPLHEWYVGSGVTRTAIGSHRFSYEAFVPATVLPAGEYALFIANDTMDIYDWYWLGGSGQHFSTTSDGGTWVETPGGPAARLTGGPAEIIPEPASLSLLALGGLGLLRRRRRG